MRETAWRTDEPCPVCGTGLVLVDTGSPVLRAECRLCGYAGPFDTDRLPGRRLVTAGRTTRAERMATPLARTVVKDLAAEHGACLRPVQLRRTEIDTGHVEQVLIPCGHTLASVCPSCAERARILRAAQCREGWHLDHEPVIDPDPATARPAGHGRPTGPRRKPTGTPWPAKASTRASWTSGSASWTSRSPTPGSAARCSPRGRAATGRPGAGRTPLRCPAARSAPGRSARPTPRRTARPSGRRCSSR